MSRPISTREPVSSSSFGYLNTKLSGCFGNFAETEGLFPLIRKNPKSDCPFSPSFLTVPEIFTNPTWSTVNAIETGVATEIKIETVIDTRIGSETVTTVNVTGTGTGNGSGVGIEKTVTENGSVVGVKGHTLPTASDPATLVLAPARRTGIVRVLFLVPLRTDLFAAVIARRPQNMLGNVIVGI